MGSHRRKIGPRREACVRLAINVTVVFYGCLAFYLALRFLLDLFDPEFETLAGRPRLAGAIIALVTVGLIVLFLGAFRAWRVVRQLTDTAISYLEGDGEEALRRPRPRAVNRRQRRTWRDWL
jgi:hypothetical protein